jgi:hypothetical protein
MATNPDLEFEHFLAQKLSMTRDELRVRMSQEEFGSWEVYYARMAQRQQIER